MRLTPTEVRDGLLAVVVAETNSTHVIALAGELDMANAKTFATQVEACEAEGAEAIVIDLRALEFVDSTGLALFVAAHRRLNDGAEQRLRIIPSPAPAVTRVLATTGLDAVLPLVDDSAPAA